MSGLCGIIHFNGAAVSSRALEKMAESAIHRGPDGLGYWYEEGVGLAYLALRISPEDQADAQPLVSSDENVVIVADARLDNRNELIKLLQAKGGLRTPVPEGVPITDSALILAAYCEWGDGCAERLMGDFAFAIWDARRRRLFAARDAMAMRAFYYRIEPDRLIFATEVKQILSVDGVPVRLYEPAVAAHLAGPYGLPHWTFYDGITQLAPGHALKADASGHRTWRYWDIDSGHRIRYRDEREYAEHFREVFQEAVRCRLRSDRPIGIFLSGGMDSGSIASTAGWLTRHEHPPCPELRSYSWAFEELPEGDERHISRMIVRHFGFESTDIPADAYWPLQGYPNHGPDRDEPYAGVYQELIDETLTRAKADGVGVMLSGDRGDHVIGSYVYDYPGMLRAGQFGHVWRELMTYSRVTGSRLSTTARRTLLRPLLSDLGIERRLAQPRSIPPWIPAAFADRAGLLDVLRESIPESSLDSHAARLRYQLIFSRAAVRWVMDAERVESRFGLSLADPFSDRRVAECILAMPQWVVHRFADEKRLLRAAMQGTMPDEVRIQAGKIEPAALFDRGLRDRSRKTVEMLLTDSKAASLGYLDEHAAREQYAALLRGDATSGDIWWPLILEAWLRQYW